jgi:hypothetical protein
VIRVVLALAGSVVLAGAALRAQVSPPVNPGDVLRIQLTTRVSAATANAGDAIEAVLLEHRVRGSLPRGTRVGGVVESARKAERGRMPAQLRLRFTEVGGGATPSFRMNAEILVLDSRHYEKASDGAIGVRTVSPVPESELIFGPPLGAGMGLLVGRKGVAAALGALVGFAVLYVPRHLGTTNDQYRDIDLKPGQRLSLHVR